MADEIRPGRAAATIATLEMTLREVAHVMKPFVEMAEAALQDLKDDPLPSYVDLEDALVFTDERIAGPTYGDCIRLVNLMGRRNEV